MRTSISVTALALSLGLAVPSLAQPGNPTRFLPPDAPENMYSAARQTPSASEAVTRVKARRHHRRSTHRTAMHQNTRYSLANGS